MASKNQRQEHRAAQRRKAIAQKKHLDKQAAKQPKPPSRYTNEYTDPGLLAASGPLIPGRWSLPKVLEDHLLAAGRPIAAPVSGMLMLDTGASRTCLSRQAAQELGLTPVRLQRSYGAGGVHESAVFRVRLTLRLVDPSGATEIYWEMEAQEIPDLEASVDHLKLTHGGAPVRLVGLLGRDVLRHTKLLYDGIVGRLEIKFDLDSINRFSQRGQIPTS